MLLLGYFLPVMVGILVRSYLQSIGKPVAEWSWFFNPSLFIYFVFALLYWEVPFFLVAWLGRPSRIADPGRTIIVFAGFLGTSLASILLFADFWKNLEAVILGTIIIPFLILPGTLLGLAIGWVAARIRRTPGKSSNPA
jgi:hypothetical protein